MPGVPPNEASRSTAGEAVVRPEHTTDPSDVGAPPGKGAPERCLQCGARLRGPYCHRCGQNRQSPLMPLRALMAHAADEVFGLDTRFARTLRRLFLRPGQLTTEYWAGRRTRQTPPIRLYVLASVVYFVALQVSGSNRFLFLNVMSTEGDRHPMGELVQLLPRLMFLLLPAFAALVALLYRRARRVYAEHVVFALHFHAAAFLIMPLDALVQPLAQEALRTGNTPVVIIAAVFAGAAQLGVIVYLGLALQRAYDGNRFVTAAKTAALLVSYIVVLFVVAVLSLSDIRKQLLGF